MQDATTFDAKKTGSSRNSAEQHTALQLCYGAIGISAVAAAVRYQGEAKNPAYAPAAARVDAGRAESA